MSSSRSRKYKKLGDSQSCDSLEDTEPQYDLPTREPSPPDEVGTRRHSPSPLDPSGGMSDPEDKSSLLRNDSGSGDRTGSVPAQAAHALSSKVSTLFAQAAKGWKSTISNQKEKRRRQHNSMYGANDANDYEDPEDGPADEGDSMQEGMFSNPSRRMPPRQSSLNSNSFDLRSEGISPRPAVGGLPSSLKQGTRGSTPLRGAGGNGGAYVVPVGPGGDGVENSWSGRGQTNLLFSETSPSNVSPTIQDKHVRFEGPNPRLPFPVPNSLGKQHTRNISTGSLEDGSTEGSINSSGSGTPTSSGFDSDPGSSYATTPNSLRSGEGGSGSNRRKMSLHTCSLSFDGVRVERQTRWCVGLSRDSVKSAAVCDVSGIFDTGALHAIVAPFDNVSSTIAQALAGIIPSNGGVIMLNQYPVQSAPYQLAVAYVDTKPIVAVGSSYSKWEGSGSLTITDDTVTANLNFAVKMRMDTSYSRSRVAAALRQLGLELYADEPVHSIPKLQQRLVHVAMELVADPCVLILDDPSNGLGLDEFAEFTRWMQKVAQEGNRAVVMAMRTLPWTLFESVESMLLCTRDGRTIFSGHTARCVRFLKNQMHISLGEISSGESILDVITEWDTNRESRKAVNAFSNSAYGAELQRSLKTMQDLVMSSGFRKLPYTPPPPPQCFLRFLTLAYDTLRRTLLRSDFFFAWIALFGSFFLCAALSQRQHSDQNGMQNKRGIIFFLLSCVVHVNGLFIESEILDFSTFVRLRQRHYFNTFSYILVTVWRLALPRVLFSLAAAAFSTYVFRAASIPLAILAGLTSFTHAILLLISVAIFKSSNHVMVAHLIYFLYSVIFSGFLLSNPSVPWFLSRLSLLQPGYAAAVAEELRGQPYSCDANEYRPSYNKTDGARDHHVRKGGQLRSYCYTGDRYLELQGFQNDDFGSNSVKLTVTSLMLLVVLFVTLYVRR